MPLHAHFRLGLFGFSMLTDFTIEPGVGPFFRMSSHTDSTVFTLIDPSEFFPDYTVPIYAEQCKRLGIHEGGDYYVYNIVTPVSDAASKRPIDFTANLLGPLVIGPVLNPLLPTRAQGEQFLLTSERWTCRHSLFSALEKRRAPCQG